MPKLVVGAVFGFLVAATAAWALEVKIPPRITAKANLVVDELGNVLFGATPAKIEVTNFPPSAGGGHPTLKDANGMVVGVVLSDSIANPVHVLRNVGGVDVEIVARQFLLDGTENGELYFESNDCTGPPYMVVTTGTFYAGTHRGGTALYYATEPATPRDVHSDRTATDPTAACNVRTYLGLQTHPVATLDLAQFVPPFHVE
jgi:hypothetical protein